ncbi:pectinesterase family protein [Marinoscillum sp. MHG1-6]|uniref:pectinesterase family protein n=1 Tax=Marinoscillum sp. MHG1-6 TaxID=2959627 RepID=UPI0021585D3C|nr:pectinesterase family protein [Marinoscillum sp. MHG1-6]
MKKIIQLFGLCLLLAAHLVKADYTDSVSYDFRDGTIISNQVSEDGKLTLSGAYSHHGTTYGLNLKVNQTISIQVSGSCLVRFIGSQYSSLDLKGTAFTDGDLGTQATQVVNDLSDTYDFVYSGPGNTLTFTAVLNSDGGGSDIYLPKIEVIPAQAGKDPAMPDYNVPYYFDLRDESIYASGAGNHVESGLIILDAGCCNGLSLNGSQHGITFKTGNTITLQVAGNSYIRIAGDQYSNADASSISASSSTGTFDIASLSNKTDITYPQGTDGGPWVEFLYLGDTGTVVLTANTSTSYIPYLEVSPVPFDVVPWEQKSGSVNINGTDINFTAGADEDSDPTVTVSKGHVTSLTLEEASIRIDLGGAALSSFTPVVSGDVESAAIDGNILTLTMVNAGNSNPGSYAIEIIDGSIVDVWDFGAEVVPDTGSTKFKNWLDSATINAWYDGAITPGTAGNVMPTTFTSGVFTWTGGTNDRLRTTNTSLTRYDANTKGEFAGRLYINKNPAPDRRFTVELNKDDELELWMYAENADGELHFQFADSAALQDDIASVPISTVTEVNFVAKYAGSYYIYDAVAKPSFMRIYRKDATYVTISGTVDETNASGIPVGYSIEFTNQDGNSTSTVVNAGAYTVSLPAGYSYDLSLINANGFVIETGATLEVTSSTTTHDLAVKQIALNTVTGNITGLGGAISNLTLIYTPDPAAEKIFVPEPVINTDLSTYSVQLEPNVQYTISAEGVNDFEIPSNTITITADGTADVAFSSKTTYDVTITAEGLSEAQLGVLNLTFTNLHEDGYVYNFSSLSGITLRDGTYTVTNSGLDDYPVEQALTSNLTVNGANVSKTIPFVPVKKWTFDDPKLNGLSSHKGLLFTGNIGSEPAKSHLTAKPGATINIPVEAGDKITMYYYYSAAFSIGGGDTIVTSSGSTSLIESTDFIYEGAEAGYVEVVFGTAASTSYITDIVINDVVALVADITVGDGKDYETINAALDAIRSMDRPNDERVTVWIDAGNYEEMLVIDMPNVTLKNAASNPTIGLLNKGVDITDGAVRITSYYGHGYNYYSMGTDQKWHADVLAVNNENGYTNYDNTGSGTTNGSYWNATVVVFASGFEADNIIFENSFNQYISLKESQDVVVEKSDGKGTRPTDYGNTAVQNRSFVERAAALSIGNNVDRVVLYNCRVVGRQDSFFGGIGSRVAIYRGAYMGAVDYIFGGMTAAFYKSDLVMNVSDVSGDASYLTAAQQGGGRGFLMYECNVTSTEPGIETASTFRAKPGYFGRPWQANTSEVVFYKTNVETSDYTGSEGLSLISPAGWNNSLGGTSPYMYEYGTNEESGIDNSSNRADWSTVLSEPKLTDGTDITLFNFTKGDDGWDPFQDLIDKDSTLTSLAVAEGTLSPAFDPTTSNYSVEVPFGTTDLNITAKASSNYATVSTSEYTSLPANITITVTSESGSTMEYMISVSVADETLGNDLINDDLIIYPNPVATNATLSYSVRQDGNINICLLSLNGAIVQKLLSEPMKAGNYDLNIDARKLDAGLYIIQMKSASETKSLRLIVR